VTLALGILALKVVFYRVNSTSRLNPVISFC